MKNKQRKVLWLLFFVPFCLGTISLNAQTISKAFRHETLKNVLREVEQQTKMSVIYKVDEVNENKDISATFKKTPLKEVLSKVLDDNLEYEIQNKMIIIHKRIPSAKRLSNPNNQNNKKLIKGKVVDEKGEPIIGANVVAKGNKSGSVTDMNGEFEFDASGSNTFIVSYIGYKNLQIPITKKQYYSITMVEDSKLLNEVVVVGYGTVYRKSVVGAVDQVKSSTLENRPVANVTQALQGASPNLIVQQRSFNPNDATMNLNIRGISTTNSNSPLIVIDGLVSDDSSLDKLNPMDIDNISILKDAGTAAIYGSRSANGVILVTTKKGKKNERTTVRVNSMMGWEKPHFLFSPVAGYQNATLKNLALTNSGMNPIFTPEQIRNLAAHQSEEDWFYYQIFRTALQQNHNISVSGGSDKTTYMVSVGYYNQESNYVGNKNFGIQRYNIRSNITTEVGRFKFTTLMAYTRNNSLSTTGSSLEIDASRIPPYYYYKMKTSDGRYLLNDVLSEFNPLGSLEAGGTNKYRNNDFTANVSAELQIIDGLKLKGVLGANVTGDHRYSRHLRVPYYSNEGDTTPARYANETRETSDWNYDAYLINSQILLDYNKTFGKHNFTGLLGATNESFTSTANEINLKYSNIDLGTSASDDAQIVVGGGSSVTPENTLRTSITSILGRLGYSYADKYYAEFDFRYDGSSKFASGYRWGFFPSLSLGWRASEESFMENYKDHVGDLKLRGSYGVLGNQTIGAYDRFTTYDMYTNTYAYNNKTVTGAGFTLGKENLTWEKTRILNLGLDANFLNNNLNVTFDYFYKRTVDILMTPVVPSVFGTTQAMDNIGEMSNKGWELSINYRLKTGQFIHNFTANIGDSFNKVEKFPEKEQITSMEELYKLIRVGVPLGSYYGYKTAGFFKNYEDIEASAIPVGGTVQPGDLKFVDRNKDGIIDSKDRFILGNGFPRYTFGFTYNLNWKNFDLSIFGQGVGKRSMMLRGELIEPFHQNYSYVIYKHQLDYWTPTHTDARWPRLSAAGSTSNSNNFRNGSDLYILNGSYLRIKDITLGYTLPKEWIKKIGMEKLRVYITGQNLFTFSHNSFIDPESSEFNSQMDTSGANSGRNYPTLKYYGFGLDVEF